MYYLVGFVMMFWKKQYRGLCINCEAALNESVTLTFLMVIS